MVAKKRYKYSDPLLNWINHNSLGDRFDRDLEAIEHLDLSWTEVNELPEEIGKLKNLKSINLSYSAIKVLPNSLCELENLHTIDLKGSEIFELPESIAKLSSLKNLDLDLCDIQSVPESVGDMTWLKDVKFSSSIYYGNGNSCGDCPLPNCGYTKCPISNLPNGVARGCSRAT